MLRHARTLIVIAGILLAVNACVTIAPDLTRSYQGPGSRWEATINQANFTFVAYASSTATDAQLTVTGTTTLNPTNLFRTFTVVSAVGSLSPSPGDQAIGLEIPGTALFLRTIDSPTPLVLVDSACPTASVTANWVITKPRLEEGTFKPENFASDGAGTVVYSSSDQAITVVAAGITDGILSVTDAKTISLTSACANGVANNVSGSDVFDLYFTAAGNAVVKFPEAIGSQIIVALPRPANQISTSDLAGTYSVLVYQGGENPSLTDATLDPAQIVFAGGVGTITTLTDVANNTLSSAQLGTLTAMSTTDDAASALPNGMVRFTLDGGLTGQVTCAASTGTPKVLACHGYKVVLMSPTDWYEPITIVGVGRP